VASEGVALHHLDQPPHAFLRDVVRHELVGHLGGGRARPG
jgi:hypothetical protein